MRHVRDIAINTNGPCIEDLDLELLSSFLDELDFFSGDDHVPKIVVGDVAFVGVTNEAGSLWGQ